MWRAIRPALKKNDEQNLNFFTFNFNNCYCIFLWRSLMYGKHTNLAIAEYWVGGVVHLG